MRRPIIAFWKKPVCPYCGKTAELRHSADVYPYAKQDYGQFWVCPGECGAWVGCHANSKRHPPLGRLANKELRKWKKQAHEAFDKLWLEDHPDYEGFSREGAYQWLSSMMGRVKQVHIGWCDVDECKQIVEILNERK